MKASFGLILAAVVMSVAAVGQPSPAKLEFEVASVRASPPSPSDQVKAGVHIDGAQIRSAFLSLKDYIGIAYRLRTNRISGPDWIASERFDISAKLPDGATAEQIPEMMQSLLAQRFQVTAHRDTKELPVYMLEVAKGGLKVQEVPPDPDPDSADAKKGLDVSGGGGSGGIAVDLGKGSYYTFANNRFEGKKVTATQLAAILETFMDRPIVDKTDLKGRYDVALELSPEDYRAMLIRAGTNNGAVLPPEVLRFLDLPSGDTLMNALQKLGLSLTARKGTLDVLVVDQARKTPTEN